MDFIFVGLVYIREHLPQLNIVCSWPSNIGVSLQNFRKPTQRYMGEIWIHYESVKSIKGHVEGIKNLLYYS
jgi:hypothetical protein